MAQQFSAMRNGGTIKSELSRLTQRMSSGRVEDVTTHLNGRTERFSGVRHSIAQLDGHLQSARETSQMLANMQMIFQRVDLVRAETSRQLLSITPDSQPTQINEAATAARGAFASMVSALNTRLADRALMGGVSVDMQPLADADDMLANLQVFVGGATTSIAIMTAVDNWFDDPAGGFATIGYLGDTGDPIQKRLNNDTLVRVDARADDPAVKQTLKAAAIAALVSEVPTLVDAAKYELLQEAATRLFAASSGLVAMQSRIGLVEETVQRAEVEMNAQQAALKIVANDLISADPFDTASRLQAVQLQLETHYTVTARMSQLSLLRYI
ncbi:MAG: flagellar biosynthesis protein FlgL [Yoonia sp.]|nr:flagellar biosynthesis protein FlgL [Yoonia sp.]